MQAARAAPAAPAAPAPATPAPAAQPSTASPPAPPPLDLSTLEQRLRETKAIGVFTKLSLKNQVDDLLSRFRSYYQARGTPPPTPLRPNFDGLLLKVVTLLQDGDPPLAAAIQSSRESLWGILSDPERLSRI